MNTIATQNDESETMLSPEAEVQHIDEVPSQPEAPALEVLPEQPVHPFAASFPMLGDEELEALIDDIRSNGLRHSIVLDKSGQLIDGRNRLKACTLAGVEPTFTTTEADPIAYILSANVTRRHLSKGQCAMAYAIAYPVATEKGGRGKTTVLNTGVSSEYITKARFVLHHTPDLAIKVMAGSSLAEAYTYAADQKREREEYEALRNRVRDHVDSIAGICARLKSNAEKPETVFLDQEDFVRQVHSEAKQIIEHATDLAEII